MAKGYISNRQKNLKVGISSYTENQEVLSVVGKVGIGTVIDIVHYDTQNNGTLSWEASEGTLFSISNNLSSGSIFSVNPISGIPIIDVNADRTIALNPYGGNTGIGTTNPTSKLSVVGDGNFTGVVTASSFSGNASSATYATSAGIATYATSAGIATYATSAGIATYSTASGVSTSVSGGIASVTQLNVTGVSTFENNVNIAGTVGIGTAIDIVPYDTLNSGTLSFEGSAGQLFSITNNLTSGSIFSVNDVSGIPSIDVDADGTVQIVPYGGNVGLGTTNPTSKLTVVGDGNFTGVVTASSFSGNASSATYATSAGIATYATSAGVSTSVSGGTASVTQLDVTGVSTFGGNVYLGDNDNLYFGDGSDLRIYHNGVDSYISDVGAGGLNIGGSVVSIKNAAQSQDYFVARTGTGVVELYNNGDKKFETTGAGATVFGTLQSQQVNISGVVTATSFVGDGSNITGISTLNIVDYGVGLGGGGASISTTAPSSPTEGDLWYNSNLGRTFIYYTDEDSSQWVDAAPFNITKDEPAIQAGKTSTTFTATQGQKIFTVSHTIGYVDVFLNGVRLSSSEFAEDGTSIILVDSASAGDIIDVVEYRLGIGATGPAGAPGESLTIGTRSGAYTQNAVGTGITISLRSGIGTANF